MQLYQAVAVQVVRAVIGKGNAGSRSRIPNGPFTANGCIAFFELVADTVFIDIDLAVAFTIKDGSGVEARFLICFRRSGVEVARILNGTPDDLLHIANTVAIHIADAVAFAVVAFRGVRARAVVVGGGAVVVARVSVLATRNLKLVAYAVAVCIRQAIAFAVVAVFSVFAISCIRCLRVVVAGAVVLTTRNLKRVAHTVTVCIAEAVAVAVVSGFRSVAFAVTRAFSDAVTAAHAALVKLEA